MKQRKGFTLIELMIVIAIIIILAAIAIPNYLRMTDRARRSRVAGDFASIATALEAYSVDWGQYPEATAFGNGAAEAFGKNAPGSHTEKEIAGTGAAATETNVAANTTLTGELGAIDYIKLGTLTSMYNPFIPTAADTTDCYFYGSNTTGTKWVLYVQRTAASFLSRTDSSTDLAETGAAPVTPIP